MDLSWFFIYILPILTVLAVGLLGSTRRIGFWGGVVLSVLLVPLAGPVLAPAAGLLAALLSGAKRPASRKKHGQK